MSKSTPAARSKARRFALQALYQVQLNTSSLWDVEQQFKQDHDMKRVDTTYFHGLLAGIATNREALQEAVTEWLDRPWDELDPIEKSVLQIGAFELMHRIDVPYRVVINESVELAKQFGAAESHKYVNSILDQLAKIHRQAEVANHRQQR
ncbi:MAG: transcription antitermination factor NusB [Pseudomonadales bacterium]|nr:transcription antitermination factor NusB [Pseudomonadales bacterium]